MPGGVVVAFGVEPGAVGGVVAASVRDRGKVLVEAWRRVHTRMCCVL